MNNFEIYNESYKICIIVLIKKLNYVQEFH